MEGSSSTSPQEQTVQFEGNEYRVIKEGRAHILNPLAQEAASKGPKRYLKAEDEAQTVFYNPIQQFNRDLSVLAIQAHANHVQALAAQKAKRMASAKGRKRKRDDEQTSNGEADAAKTQNDNQPASATNSDATSSLSFTILDALSATGLRALRYASEIPLTTCVVANDLSSSAIQSMKMNIEYNKLSKLIQPNIGDARAYMYGLSSPVNTKDTSLHKGKFDVIDLDPYGSAAQFLDAAVQAVKDGGLMCVTCTDAGVWASNGYPEKAFSLYGGVPLKGSHSHEAGLRLILHGLATAAAKYGLAIEPLLSLSIDFYARVFVRVHRSPAEVKFLSGKTMVVYNCDAGCGAWTTQPITQTKPKTDKNGNLFYHHGFSQGPVADRTCSQCGIKTHLAGPMWAGPLHNPDFIQKVLDLLPGADRDIYHTVDRIEGMLTTALEEDLDIGDPLGSESPGPVNVESEGVPEIEYSAIIPRVDPSLREQHPFYFALSSLSKVIHTSTIPFDAFRGALRHLGYRSTRSHAKPNTVRTDAPWEVVWEVMREWARQKSPIKESSLKPGTAGAALMAKSREKLQKSCAAQPLDFLRQEIVSAAESGKDIADLVTKVEAALYRSGSRHATGTSTTDTLAKGEVKLQAGQAQNTPGQSVEKPHPSELNVVFDEALGRQSFKSKRLVRYQINPRANWGPLNRASGRS